MNVKKKDFQDPFSAFRRLDKMQHEYLQVGAKVGKIAKKKKKKKIKIKISKI